MPVDDAGVADIIGAASLLISEAAFPGLVARAGAGVTPRGTTAEPEATSNSGEAA